VEDRFSILDLEPLPTSTPIAVFAHIHFPLAMNSAHRKHGKEYYRRDLLKKIAFDKTYRLVCIAG
jgi:hypothetical protein